MAYGTKVQENRRFQASLPGHGPGHPWAEGGGRPAGHLQALCSTQVRDACDVGDRR